MKKINCILLVDDSPADNTYHSIIIEQCDACEHLRAVEDGLRALEYLKKSVIPGNEIEFPKANLIFLDINMPRMNGFEFLEAYCELDEECRSGIVIAMLTTSLNPADRKRALATGGIAEFRSKPLSVETLEHILEEYF